MLRGGARSRAAFPSEPTRRTRKDWELALFKEWLNPEIDK
jgi:hypothetical protein